MTKRSIILLFFVGFLFSCQPQPEKQVFSGQTMGTTYNIILISQTKIDKTAVQKAINHTLQRVNTHLSNWDKHSEVSRFNNMRKTAPFPVSSMLREVMEGAMHVHQHSDGFLDVTTSPLVELWGFGVNRSQTAAPSEVDIQKARVKVGQSRKLTLQGNMLTKLDPQVEVNLSAIAKGFGVDALARTLTKLGFDNFMVEIGGDLRAKGTNIHGHSWKIGIEKPTEFGKHIEQIVPLNDLSMATSGDYRNYFEQDGQRYSHLLNPKTGKPVTHRTTSVTVLADTAMMADAWATALLILGKTKGMELAVKHKIAALFISSQNHGETPSFATLASPAFTGLTTQK